MLTNLSRIGIKFLNEMEIIYRPGYRTKDYQIFIDYIFE